MTASDVLAALRGGALRATAGRAAAVHDRLVALLNRFPRLERALLVALVFAAVVWMAFQLSVTRSPDWPRIESLLSSPAAVSAAPTAAAGSRPRAAFDLLPGSSFLADASDGRAQLGVGFSRPTSPGFARLIALPQEDDEEVILDAAMEASDDGVAWRSVGAFTRTAPTVWRWTADQETSPAAYWRASLTGIGPRRDLMIAELEIGPKRTSPPDELAVALMSIAMLLAFRRRTGRFRVTLAAFAAVSAYLVLRWNSSLFLSGEFWAIYGFDSDSYLSWSSTRPPGVGLLLNALNVTGDYRASAIAQTNLMLASVVFLFAAVGRCLSGYGVATAGLLATGMAGGLADLALVLMSEALFVSFVSLSLGAVLLALRAPNARLAGPWWLAAGAALGAAMWIKPLTPALAVALAWAAVLARPEPLRSLALAMGPVIVGYATAGLAALAKFGSFGLSTIGPLAMAAHVAWWLEPDPAAKHPEFIADVAGRVDRLQAAWPESRSWPFEIALLQLNSYNTVAYQELGPAIAEEVRRSGASDVHGFSDELLAEVAATAIRQCPQCYVSTVLAQYLSLWRHVGVSFGRLRDVAERGRTYIEEIAYPAFGGQPIFETLDYDLDRLNAARLDAATVRTPLDRYAVLAERATRGLRWVALVVSLTAAGLGAVALIRRRPLSAAVAGLIATSLMLNAFYGVQALAQPAATRYAVTGLAWFWALLALAGGIGCASLWRRVFGDPQAPERRA